VCRLVGLRLDEIWSVSPGDYRRRNPDPDFHELLALGHRPAS
jgi:hypothetical protein